MSHDDWVLEFSKYRASPEFKKLNSRMTLEEFKFIFWMEYAHRMWGRALGLVFALPAAYFAASGYIGGALAARLVVLFGMGGVQVRFKAACPVAATIGAGSFASRGNVGGVAGALGWLSCSMCGTLLCFLAR
jgi:hypothetical protein